MAIKIDRKLNGQDVVEKEFGDFLDNGGTIGGDITRVNHEKAYDFTFGHSGFTNNSAMLRLRNRVTDASMGLNFNILPGVSSSITPTLHDETDLGLPNYSFKDVYLGQPAISSIGFTKLPNGMIMQWGWINTRMETGRIDTVVNFPISFPTKSLLIIPNILTVDGSDAGIVERTIGHAGGNDKNGFWFRAENIDRYGSSIEFTWFAIGY